MRAPLAREELGPNDTLPRRFPLEQSGKVRPIDDLSRSQINSTVTCYEQATMDGPDVISALATFFMRCLSKIGKATTLVGRSLDLASAYSQLAVADDSLSCAFLSVFNPDSGSAAPFSTGGIAVWFQDGSQCLHTLCKVLAVGGLQLFQIALSCYFDGFVSFASPALAKNAQSTLCLMLDILGRNLDREGPKSDDFSSLVSAPGVRIHLEDTSHGVFEGV